MKNERKKLFLGELSDTPWLSKFIMISYIHVYYNIMITWNQLIHTCNYQVIWWRVGAREQNLLALLIAPKVLCKPEI